MTAPAESAGLRGPGRWELVLPRGRRLIAGPRPLVAGIVNVTPDSFSDGGSYASARAAVEAGLRLLADGADLLDVGGESTRPGALPVAAEEQLRRVIPVLEGLRSRTDAPISIDTQSAGVAEAALGVGADILNDVSACRDPGMKDVLRRREVPVILMHMKGTPLDMQVSPEYPEGVVDHVKRFFAERLELLAGWGISPGRTILDPGIGFGKRLQHNLELIRNIGEFHDLARPLYLGVSRKGFIGKVLGQGRPGEEELEDRDLGTLIVNALALARGCDFLRVHNVKYASALVRLHAAIDGASLPSVKGGA